jgi:thymidylate synthase
MHLYFDGVNDSFNALIQGFESGEIRTTTSPSRVGDVRLIPEPVTLTYYEPRQRVLFNQARDCNPFFHLYEAMWMLAGRNDIAPLAYYSSGYPAQVDDGNGVANGAYGYRWRKAQYIDLSSDPSLGETPYNICDQLTVVIDHLKRKPESRRVVLQMWNVKDDLLKIDSSKDVCCNTAVYFMILNGKLEMTVTNRSNDLIWGSLGANFVHFSFLQEYIANCLGIEVGYYHQFSNNLHSYTSRWTPEKWLSDETPNYYRKPHTELPQLVQYRETFDTEVRQLVEAHSSVHGLDLVGPSAANEPFLRDVFDPMCRAFHMHKERYYELALSHIDNVKSMDWQVAGRDWIQKRKAKWERSPSESSTNQD